MRALRPLLLSALVVGIAVTILMEASVIAPRRVPNRGQPTGYGGQQRPLEATDFVINAVSSSGGFPAVPVVVGAAALVAVAGGCLLLLLRRRRRRVAA